MILLILSTLLARDSLIAINLLAQMAFLTYVIAVIFRVVFKARLVDGNILCGAASLYLMIGVLIGFIYSFIELIEQGFISLPSGRPTPPGQGSCRVADIFQLTALTTVSLGDILPTTDIARAWWSSKRPWAKS